MTLTLEVMKLCALGTVVGRHNLLADVAVDKSIDSLRTG